MPLCELSTMAEPLNKVHKVFFFYEAVGLRYDICAESVEHDINECADGDKIEGKRFQNQITRAVFAA